VRADDDVDFTVRKIFEDRLLLFGRLKARDRVDLDRVIFHPSLERLLMLKGKDGRRHENRDLLAVRDRAKGGADRYFSFAVTDVTADEAIHHAAGFEVAQDLIDGLELVGGFVERKFGFELAKKRIPRRKREAGTDFSFGVELDEIDREPFDFVAYFFFCFGELLAAELVELDSFSGADVFLDDVEAIDREIELVLVGVFEQEKIAGRSRKREAHETAIAPDTVIDVHDGVADAQV
jgi:hypothetical protein